MPFTTSGLEMEQTYSYKPEARMWLRPMEVYDLQLRIQILLQNYAP